jgi:hypothetical protein
MTLAQTVSVAHNPCNHAPHGDWKRMAKGRDRAVTAVKASPHRPPAVADVPMADLFRLLWDALADLLGTAAVAVLVRRAAQRAVPHHPELGDLVVVRENQEYRYTLPDAWRACGDGKQSALRRLVAELLVLLAELTGPLGVRHLARIGELRERGIVPPQEDVP